VAAPAPAVACAAAPPEAALDRRTGLNWSRGTNWRISERKLLGDLGWPKRCKLGRALMWEYSGGEMTLASRELSMPGLQRRPALTAEPRGTAGVGLEGAQDDGTGGGGGHEAVDRGGRGERCHGAELARSRGRRLLAPRFPGTHSGMLLQPGHRRLQARNLAPPHHRHHYRSFFFPPALRLTRGCVSSCSSSHSMEW
jgi:hypothetical protein